MARLVVVFSVLLLLNSLKAATQLDLRRSRDTLAKKISLSVLPQNFYNQHLSFTCKKEIQLQKAVRMPLFIRLGSKAYVDYLERKPNSLYRKND